MAFTTAPVTEECGAGWSYDPMGGACYALNHNALTWEDASVECQDRGGNLASITGTNDQNYITGKSK